MNQRWSILGASLVGAGLMFLLDPDSGTRRRGLIRAKMAKTARRSRDFSIKAARDMTHRARGIAHDLHAKRLHREGADVGVPDRVLCDRVRSKMGHVIAHPGAVEVFADNGRVTLEGTVLRSERDHLISTVSRIPGVQDVDDRLRALPSADGEPSLQGGRHVGRVRRTLGRLDSPATRLLAGTVGAMIAAYGIQQLRHPRGEEPDGHDRMPLGRPIAAEVQPS